MRFGISLRYMNLGKSELLLITLAAVIVLCFTKLFLSPEEYLLVHQNESLRSDGGGSARRDSLIKTSDVIKFGDGKQKRYERTSFMTHVLFSWDPYSTTEPPPDSLFWKLWRSNFGLASNALSTRFVEGVRTGDLSREVYTAWSQSDAFYCAQSALFYKLASDRAYGEHDEVLGRFLRKKYEWFKSYNDFFYNGSYETNGNESDVNGNAVDAVPSRVILEYVSFQHWVVLKFHPVYTLIVMLPCEWLWAWLTQKLSTKVDASNEYIDWIRYNTDASSAFASANFIHNFMKSHDNIIVPSIADELYRTAIIFEIDNFNDI